VGQRQGRRKRLTDRTLSSLNTIFTHIPGHPITFSRIHRLRYWEETEGAMNRITWTILIVLGSALAITVLLLLRAHRENDDLRSQFNTVGTPEDAAVANVRQTSSTPDIVISLQRENRALRELVNSLETKSQTQAAKLHSARELVAAAAVAEPEKKSSYSIDPSFHYWGQFFDALRSGDRDTLLAFVNEQDLEDISQDDAARITYWEQSLNYVLEHGPSISHIHVEEADGYGEETYISFQMIRNGFIEHVEIGAYGDPGNWKLSNTDIDEIAYTLESITGKEVHPEEEMPDGIGGATFRLDDIDLTENWRPEEVLEHLWGVQRFWQAADFDGNGLPDSWTRDIAGLYATERDGVPVGLITKRIAEADMAPARGYRVLDRTGVPLNGYLYRVMERDANGTPYAETGRMAHCAVPSPYDCLNGRPILSGKAGSKSLVTGPVFAANQIPLPTICSTSSILSGIPGPSTLAPSSVTRTSSSIRIPDTVSLSARARSRLMYASCGPKFSARSRRPETK
jgi:hypothetical protein